MALLSKYIVHLNSMTFQMTNYNFQNLLQSFEFTVEDYSLALLINAISPLLVLYIAKHSSIQYVWEIEP